MRSLIPHSTGLAAPATRARLWVGLITLAAAIALGLKLWLATGTYGTNDVRSWEQYRDISASAGTLELYRRVEQFNHPPMTTGLLRLMGWLAATTSIAFPFWLRLPAILADVGALILVAKILTPGSRGRFAGVRETLAGTRHAGSFSCRSRANFPEATLTLMAISPISIMVSGFHGNTDPVMIALVLLAVYLLDVRPVIWLGGAALGMSMNVKVVPLVLVPVFFFYLPTWKRRGEFFGTAAVVFGLASLPYIVQDPLLIGRKVLCYGSLYGNWGIARLLRDAPPPWHGLDVTLRQYGRYGIMAVLATVAYLMNRNRTKPSLFTQCGVIIFLFMTISTGFGVQYLAWLVPWVVEVGFWPCLIFYSTTGVFLGLVYTHWSRGFPWYFADSCIVGDWQGSARIFEWLSWATVAMALVLLIRQVRLAARDADTRVTMAIT